MSDDGLEWQAAQAVSPKQVSAVHACWHRAPAGSDYVWVDGRGYRGTGRRRNRGSPY